MEDSIDPAGNRIQLGSGSFVGEDGAIRLPHQIQQPSRPMQRVRQPPVSPLANTSSGEETECRAPAVSTNTVVSQSGQSATQKNEIAALEYELEIKEKESEHCMRPVPIGLAVIFAILYFTTNYIWCGVAFLIAMAIVVRDAVRKADIENEVQIIKNKIDKVRKASSR